MKDRQTFMATVGEGSRHYNIHLSGEQLELLADFRDLVISWNTRMNLVSKRDMERFAEYHVLDSLKIASAVSFSGRQSGMDFGSGAGLPGIPLAIAFPHMHWTLVDSRLKRCQFLQQCVTSLSLDSVTVLRERIEYLDSSHDFSYDCVCTRATVSLADFYVLCHRFVGEGGFLAAVKGSDIKTEAAACTSVVDPALFHIFSTVPPHVDGVRDGSMVIISRR